MSPFSTLRGFGGGAKRPLVLIERSECSFLSPNCAALIAQDSPEIWRESGSQVRAHVLWCDQLYLMAQLGHLTRPVVGTAASLHHDDRRTLLGHEFAKMLPGEPPPELDFSRQQSSVHLENAFRQIDPDHCIVCHAAILHPLDLTR